MILIKEGHIHICDFNKRRAYKFTCCRPIKVMWVDPLTFTHISDRNPPLQQRDLHGNINIVFYVLYVPQTIRQGELPVGLHWHLK